MTDRIKQRDLTALAEEILLTLGEDTGREGLKGTPARMAKAWTEFFSGYQVDPYQLLHTCFSEVNGYDDIVLLRNIRVESHCEHHFVPIIGTAHVAYLPSKRVVGISKLARVVEAYAKRLQIQERLTIDIARTIMDVLEPLGCAVVIDSQHHCMTTRGVHQQNTSMVTSAMLGSFREDPAQRLEVLTLMKGI
jgi:GTP cyclohydrolase I